MKNKINNSPFLKRPVTVLQKYRATIILIWGIISLGLLASPIHADTNDSLQLHSQFEGTGMSYATAGNSEIVYNTVLGNKQICAKNNGAATSSNLLNSDGTSVTFAGDASIKAVYLQWYALVRNTDPDGTGLNNLNPLANSVTLTLPDNSVNTVTGSKFYEERTYFNTYSQQYQGYLADITSLVKALPLSDADGTYKVDLAGQNDSSLSQFKHACAFAEENARAWQMTIIYASPSTVTDSRKVYFYDGIQGLVDQTGVITPVTGYEVPASGDTTGKVSVMTLQGDSAIPGETMTTSDTLFPNMPVDFANSAGITSATGTDAGNGDPFGGWDIDTLTGDFTAGSTSMNLVSGSVGDLFLITGVVLEIPTIPTIPPVVNQCFAMSDDVAELYSFDFNLGTPPNKVAMTRMFNGEGTAYRAADNALYVFDQAVIAHDNPSDLYKVNMDGSSSLIVTDFIASRASGAEFVQYSDGTEKFMVLMDELDSHIQIFDASDLASKTPLKTLNLTFPGGSKAQVNSLAINPKTGEILVTDDADATDDYPEIYSVNMHTGQLTLKVILDVPGIDAESLAFAEDGFAYIENEGTFTSSPYSHNIYRVNLSTGELTAVEENIDAVISGDIEGMSCTGSKMTTPPSPTPTPYDPQPCGVPGFLETFGAGIGRAPIPTSAWSNYDYDEGSTDANNGAIVEDDQYVVLDKSTIPSAGHWWIVDDDHTGDPNGRMLMVNANYFAGEFYRQSITGLTVGKNYSFAAYIANAEGDAEVRIPVNAKFSIEATGVEIAFVETGDILQDPGRDELAWAKYELVFTATTADIDIVLINNIGGGMGNDIVIDDISLTEVCVVCTPFSGEVTEVALPVGAQLQTTDKLFVPSKSTSSSDGHLKAYSIDSNGTPSTLSWDATGLLSDRISKLYSSDTSGDKVLFNSLDDAAFPAGLAASIKATTVAANLGGVSKGNNLDILSDSINTSLYLSDTKYRDYYTSTVSSRSQRVLMSSDDGFLYAFDYTSGALVWAWMPRSLVSQLASPASFQTKHLMAGTVDILDLPDSSGNYSTYVVGSYKSGLGHYVLKLSASGSLSDVIWDDDQSSTFIDSPNFGEMEFFRDGNGLVYASYALTNSTMTSELMIRSLIDNTENNSISLSYQVSSTPFVMQDYGKSNAPAKKTLYVGTSYGDIHSAVVLDTSDSLMSKESIQASLQSSNVTKMDNSNTDAVLYIDASVSAKDNQYYLSSQTATRLTIHKYKSSNTSWNKAWTSYSSGAGNWDESGTYSADTSGVPTDQGGFAIIPPSGIQSLPADAEITDKAIIVGDTVILPISVIDSASATCYGKAYYYIYSLSDGIFPMGSVVTTAGIPVVTNIALGYGEARRVSITNLAGTNKLIAYGIADKKADLTSGIATTFVIKDPVAGGVRGWKEIGR